MIIMEALPRSISPMMYQDGETSKTETFTWNIGDINDTEIVLSYYVYLKGSMDRRTWRRHLSDK